MANYNKEIKNKAIELRKQGKTYFEIKNLLQNDIPKSTLSSWLRNIELSDNQKKRVENIIKENINRHRLMALNTNYSKRSVYLNDMEEKVKHLKKACDDMDVAKIALAMLYVAEGSKHKSAIEFTNSDPAMTMFFLRLLKKCYITEEQRFRCTVQCRADHDITFLEKFWSDTTGISSKYFYKTFIDPRTIGKPSKRPDYKGVCRINYFNSEIDLELKMIAKMLFEENDQGS